MEILEILATIAGIAMAFANIPQIIKIFQRKSAKDISSFTYSILTIGSIIWVLYGLSIKSLPIIIAHSSGMILTAGVLLGWFLYGREK